MNTAAVTSAPPTTNPNELSADDLAAIRRANAAQLANIQQLIADELEPAILLGEFLADEMAEGRELVSEAEGVAA